MSITNKEKIKKEILTFLGAGMVRVELTNDQLDLAITLALDTYKQRSAGAKEEAWLSFVLHEGQSTYTLPDEVQQVRKIFRRGNGVTQGSGSTMDPFSLAYSNTYLLSAVKGSGGGGLLTYDLYSQFDKTVGMMFGREIMFNWNSVTKNLTLHRDIRGTEDVLLWAYHMKPDEVLLADFMIKPWLRSWAIAESKIILGKIRGKISAIPGPNGGISLNGDAMVQEGTQEKADLLIELKNRVDGSAPLGFIIG
jgi:hypothetical protein